MRSRGGVIVMMRGGGGRGGIARGRGITRMSIGDGDELEGGARRGAGRRAYEIC